MNGKNVSTIILAAMSSRTLNKTKQEHGWRWCDLRPYHKVKFDPKTALHVFEMQFIQQRLFHTTSCLHLLVPTHDFLLASKLRWMLLAFDFRFLAFLAPFAPRSL